MSNAVLFCVMLNAWRRPWHDETRYMSGDFRKRFSWGQELPEPFQLQLSKCRSDDRDHCFAEFETNRLPRCDDQVGSATHAASWECWRSGDALIEAIDQGIYTMDCVRVPHFDGAETLHGEHLFCVSLARARSIHQRRRLFSLHGASVHGFLHCQPTYMK